MGRCKSEASATKATMQKERSLKLRVEDPPLCSKPVSVLVTDEDGKTARVHIGLLTPTDRHQL